MTRPAAGPRFRLELVAVPGDGPPVEVRVRRALKFLLRQLGLRVVLIEQVQDAASGQPPEHDRPAG